MDFSFEPTNIIKTIKRTMTVTVAGFALAIAAVAAPVPPDLNNMTIPNPLEQVIASATPSLKMPEWDIDKMSLQGRRTRMLEESLRKNGYSEMDNVALRIWDELVPNTASIPFDKIFAQYDSDSESFFFVFDFKSGQRLEATIYVDENDDDVYFSVVSKSELFFQNVLPEEEFFDRAKSTWGRFKENNV